MVRKTAATVCRVTVILFHDLEEHVPTGPQTRIQPLPADVSDNANQRLNECRPMQDAIRYESPFEAEDSLRATAEKRFGQFRQILLWPVQL
jgi:hypothetical protein